jgi:GntR family transcriptional regulator
LEDEGILRRERGRGTFLQTNQAENWSGQLLGFSEAIRGIGMEPGSEVLAYGTVKEVPETVKSHLQLDELWELKRLRYADNVAIAIEHNYFPMEVGRQLEEQDLLTVTIYKFIESEAGITLRNGKQLISAINANKEEAELLDVAEGSALLSIERVIYDAAQNPIEYLKAVYRPDHFQYTIHLHR